ncbi:MAG: hypothetical protein ACYS0D_00340 [Planctomycetota bacterium]|jgi:hypothetical protein
MIDRRYLAALACAALAAHLPGCQQGPEPARTAVRHSRISVKETGMPGSPVAVSVTRIGWTETGSDLKPVVVLTNTGREPVASAELAYFVKRGSAILGTGPATTWSGDLAPGESVQVALNGWTGSLKPGTYKLEAVATTTNGTPNTMKPRPMGVSLFKVRRGEPWVTVAPKP